MQPGQQDDFLVLGDLGEGKYIVRMFKSNHSVDEEFSAVGAADLEQQIYTRLAALTVEEASQLDTGGQREADGQAIALTPEQGA